MNRVLFAGRADAWVFASEEDRLKNNCALLDDICPRGQPFSTRLWWGLKSHVSSYLL